MEPKKFGGRGARAKRQKVGDRPCRLECSRADELCYSLTDKSFVYLAVLFPDGRRWAMAYWISQSMAGCIS